MKKGISPLIASILLIGFTVALAVVVFNWGISFVQEAQENVGKTTESALLCTNKLNFEISKVDCINEKITVENNGEIDIVNLTLRVHSGEEIIPVSFSDGIQAFGVKNFDLIEQGLSSGTEVDAIATILSGSGEKIICSQAIKSKKYACEVFEEEFPIE
ncbi:MAG TPA: archaellin/type IV pilin N-terminal domain-containing protein [Candidatus Nanoarchaeia archaeon]|nr:archaellin/type IV pilin N-terminal domain-containing protein [Candidatus Nanoarchaeia archaeon]